MSDMIKKEKEEINGVTRLCHVLRS